MRKYSLITMIAVASLAASGLTQAAKGGLKQFQLNVIGFAQCTKSSDEDPDCYTGNGDISNGHRIFVPLKMTTLDADGICGDKQQIDQNLGEEVAVAELKKGVRILITDSVAFGGGVEVIDGDATDGTGKLAVPDGQYELWARAVGKPGGCMDIDALICQNNVDEQVDCQSDLSNNDKFVLVGHVDVDRTGKKPHWDNVTKDLLESAGVGSGEPGFFDFLWAIFNDGVRVLQLRFIGI